jgi:HlyD family secretion protein
VSRRVPRWLIVVLVLVALGILLRFTVLKPKLLEVDVARVERGEVEETVTNTRAGTVKARSRTKLSPQIGGRVTSLPFAKGAAVPKGALLLQLDDSVQRAEAALAEEQIKTAAAQAAEARLSAQLAQREWARAEALAKDSILSKQDLDTIETKRDQARSAAEAAAAALDQARAQRALAQAQLDLTRILAPFAGILADRSTEVGEWITPSPPGVPIPPVLDLLDPSSLYVSAPIDELDAARVRTGLAVRITVDSFPGKDFRGTVVRLAPYVLDLQEQNRTLEVEADFAPGQRPEGLLPGTSADVEILLNRKEGVLRVPTSAIAEGKKVLVLSGDTLEERSVGTGLSNWRFTEITGGLKEGDRVVTARDNSSLRSGAKAEARSAPRT